MSTDSCPMRPILPMIDHMSLAVADFERSLAFYGGVLAPLGYVRVFTHTGDTGGSGCWGRPGEAPSPKGPPGAAPFWIQKRGEAVTPQPGFHLCFLGESRAAVRGFHAAGLRFGGTDDGAPGLRPNYGEGYYAALLRDPDGWKIEALTYTDA